MRTRSIKSVVSKPILPEPIGAHRGECVCVTLRRASRAISQLYDDALSPTGLKITQFSLLRAVERLEPASIGALATDMDLDRTTLARNLAPLERDGLLEQACGLDKRVAQVRLCDAGRRAIAQALPLWRTTQRAIQAHFGSDIAEQLRAINDKAMSLGSKRERQ